MTTSAEVRSQLIDTLRLDLVGPRPGHADHADDFEEVLPTHPSNWYLTGFLVPYEAPVEDRTDADGDDELDQNSMAGGGDDENTPEQASARKAYFPSSMGLSVLLPRDTAQLQVKVAWGDYQPIGGYVGETQLGKESEDEDGQPTGRPAGGRLWQRVPRESEIILDLKETDEPVHTDLPDSAPPGHDASDSGLRLVVSVRPTYDEEPSDKALPTGTRSVSVFLVNYRKPMPDKKDAAYVFQPELTLESLQPFVPRPDLRGRESTDWDERIADLQYRDAFEYVVGHNVSALALTEIRGKEKRCRSVRTSWMPTADVEKVVPGKIDNVELSMEALAAAKNGAAVREMIGRMVTEYGAWIDRQPSLEHLSKERVEVVEKLLDDARRAGDRIQAGLDLMDDPQVLEAFRIANRVIATAIRQRACHDKSELRPEDVRAPAWRPFQLAFLLMNMPGVADPSHSDRGLVDLLFFPTGGGKTEAYLGLAAFTMVLRRLRDPSIQSSGLSVLMRYTLRLLTLDQLGRAATLICALELERQEDVENLGLWPFEIGLWVGQAATPNRMGKKGDKDRYSARERTIAYQNDHKHKPSPIPLENCPWCGTKFDPNSFQLLPNPNEPQDLRVFCVSRACTYHPRRQKRGLPILAVDDEIYRRLPAFMIATVDKFANLPWVGETAGLFGRVERHDPDGFYGPCRPGVGDPLPERRLPPLDLVIQDELHLISGPLGTMVGLYETAVDALCASGGVRPKIVASTATVRRAEKQIRGLFGRTRVDIFPPPGPDRRDSFFARTVSPPLDPRSGTAGVDESNARTYLGIAAQGRNLKVVLLRTYLALLSAGLKAWRDHGGDRNPENPADPYMTLLGYFNSLRELGGSRRIVEDEVRSRLVDYGSRRQRVGDKRRPSESRLVDRKKLTEPRELTSRVATNAVAETKRRLGLTYHDKEHVDVALATNMISVGLDITRLGLMVVLGQPKAAAEYIQATSRVGRDDKRPGLVVTLLNVHRPRDRSHYERFTAWHESFYRAVEATSVTPFSPRAVDRGIAGITVALARLGHPPMTAPKGAALIDAHRADLAFVADVISRRAEAHDSELSGEQTETLRKELRGRVVELLDIWSSIASEKGELQYQREVGGAVPPLLFAPLDPELERQPREAKKFKAYRSLRDVEPGVKLLLRNPDGFDVEEPGS